MKIHHKPKQIIVLLLALSLALGMVLPSGWTTAVAAGGPPMYFYPIDGAVNSCDWPIGSTVMLTIEDPLTAASPDFQAAQPAAPDYGCVDFSGFFYQTDRPGVSITLSDGTASQTLLTSALAVTNASYTQDKVTGRADPMSSVIVVVYQSDLWAQRTVTADGAGQWAADFSVPGGLPEEQDTFDLRNRTNLSAYQSDSNGNTIQVDKRILFRQIANLERDVVNGRGWEAGATVMLEIDDPDLPDNPDYSFQAIAGTDLYGYDITLTRFDLRGQVSLSPGMTLTMSDGAFTKQLVIENLTMNVDYANDVLSGTADPGRELWFTLYDDRNDVITWDYYAVAGQDGAWRLDLAAEAPPYDLFEWTGGMVRLLDPENDVTRIVIVPAFDRDGDGVPDLKDPCPADPSDDCNPAGSTATWIDSEGGSLTTPNQAVEMSLPHEALSEPVVFAINQGEGNYEVTTDQGQALVAVSATILPHGTQFQQPVELTFAWPDADNDSRVDGSDLPESELRVFKDGVQISGLCASDPGCDPVANTFRVSVTSLSLFELGVLQFTPPVITAFNAPGEPKAVNTPVSVSAALEPFSDGLTAAWDWGDGTTSQTPVETTALQAEHSYTLTGVYTLRLDILKDGTVVASRIFEYVVVYDPAGGFVTGGGWIDSPAGAFKPDPSLAGKASFGFVSRYKKGASIPDGSTEFQFKAGDLNFHSSSYDWLVVNAGVQRAQFKGSGTINGALANGSPYRFMIWAQDGSPDTFRIKIWYEANGAEVVVYDNGVDQALGGGSIVVHMPK